MFPQQVLLRGINCSCGIGTADSPGGHGPSTGIDTAKLRRHLTSCSEEPRSLLRKYPVANSFLAFNAISYGPQKRILPNFSYSIKVYLVFFFFFFFGFYKNNQHNIIIHHYQSLDPSSLLLKTRRANQSKKLLLWCTNSLIKQSLRVLSESCYLEKESYIENFRFSSEYNIKRR